MTGAWGRRGRRGAGSAHTAPHPAKLVLLFALSLAPLAYVVLAGAGSDMPPEGDRAIGPRHTRAETRSLHSPPPPKDPGAQIIIGILTTLGLHWRVEHLKNWIEDARKLGMTVIIVTDRQDEMLPDAIISDCGMDAKLDLCCKLRFMYRHFEQVRDQFEWFVRVVDDTYVHPTNLLTHVKALARDAPLAVGNKWCSFAGPYFPGGGGWAINRAALGALRWDQWPSILNTSKRYHYDDLAFGVLLARSHIPLENYPGYQQEPANSPAFLFDGILPGSVLKWPHAFLPVCLHRAHMRVTHEMLTLGVDFSGFSFSEARPSTYACVCPPNQELDGRGPMDCNLQAPPPPHRPPF